MSDTITDALRNARSELSEHGADTSRDVFHSDKPLVILALDYLAANADHAAEFFEMKQEDVNDNL